MNLEQTALSVLEQFPTGQSFSIQRQERMLERFGQIAFGGFGVVVLTAVGGFIYLIITKLILTGVNFWGGILLTAFILFAGLTLAYVILNESLKEKRSKLNPAAATGGAELAAPETGRLLPEKDFEPAASVTEGTTRLLASERETKTQKL